MVFSPSFGNRGGAAPRRAAVRAAAAAILFVMAISTAKALAPLLLLPPAIEVLSGVMTMRNFVTASIGAHAAVALLWGNKDGSSNPATSSNGSQITVYIDPKKPLIAPSGWTEAQPGSSNTGGNPQPTAPNTAQPVLRYANGWSPSAYTYSSVADAANAHIEAEKNAVFPSYTYSLLSADESTREYSYRRCSPSNVCNTLTYTAGMQNGCPSGYSLSGDTCALTNESVVLKPFDQNCGIVRTGNTFGPDPRDPDCNNMSATMPTPSTIQLKKNNESLKAQINADGSVTTTMSAPDANGNTVTTIINFAPPGNTMGMPATGFSESTTQGSGDLNDPGVQIPKLDLPTDYNREPTQQQIKTKLDQIHESLNPTEQGPDTTLDSQKTGYDAKADAHKGIFDGIGGKGQSNEGGIFGWNWLPSLPTASCSPLDFGTSAYMTTLDLCPTLDMIRDVAGYALYILTAWSLFGILTGKQGA